MTRTKAFAIHLTISAVIASAVAALMFLLWYTPAFFAAAGGKNLLMLILGVDVTLGPLITLIIFNAKKSRKMLAFDFSVIAILQISALLYGTNIMFDSRPVFIAYMQDKFAVATADMVLDLNLEKVHDPRFKSLPLTGPVYVFSEMPTDANEKSNVELATALGMGLQNFPQYYKPYAEKMSLAGQTAKPLSALKKLNEDRVKDIEHAILSSGRAETDLGFLPLQGVGVNMTVLLDKRDGTVLDILNLNPY